MAPPATLVALEATGNYWVALAVTLHEAGYRVAVVNPRQAHHFAKAQSRRAKTDAPDARDLAQLAAALRPAPWVPPPAVYHAVRQRLVARDGLLAMRTQARNQRHALLQWPVVVAAVRQHLDALIADLDRRVAGLDAEIAAVLAESAWATSLACPTSAPGIGPVTAAWLLVGTRNFTLCAGPEALGAYAGLAPVPRESGRSVRARPAIGHDGNARLRTALSMATLSAAQHNPAIKACYRRLRAAGKPLKVARCAAARKLLHQAWALGSKQQHFNPDHKQQHDASPALAARPWPQRFRWPGGLTRNTVSTTSLTRQSTSHWRTWPPVWRAHPRGVPRPPANRATMRFFVALGPINPDACRPLNRSGGRAALCHKLIRQRATQRLRSTPPIARRCPPPASLTAASLAPLVRHPR